MFIVMNDTVYKVKFAHFSDALAGEQIGRKTPTNWKFYRKITKATLHQVDRDIVAKEPSYDAIAITHPKDKFCRATGRKVAFARLMQKFPREQRNGGWYGFFVEEASE